MPQVNKNRPLAGSERPAGRGSLLGPSDPAEHIRFTILIRQRPGSPALHELEHWQNTPPGKRRFLSTDEFLETYGGSEEDVAAVSEFLEAERLRVIERHAGRRRIEVEGTAADIDAAFGIRLGRYRQPFRLIGRSEPGGGKERAGIPEHVHRGFEGVVHLPPKIHEIVTAVIGLDNRSLGGPAGVGTGDPAGAQYLSPTAIAQRYHFPAGSAAGQTVALFEDADSGGRAAYLPADILASLPAGATPPNLTDIGLPGFSNNHALVTSGPNLANNFWGGVYECTLDVAVVAAVAPGANINVYFTSNTEGGWIAFLDRAILPVAGDLAPSVISASWILQPDDSVGGVAAFGIAGIGDPATSGTVSNVLSGYLQQAAARGITVLMAVGDWGASNQLLDTHCHVSYPNSDPWLTSCGGTILGPSAELTWSDANTGTQFQAGIFDATGGGVSDTFAIPPYQVAAGLLPISKNDGNVRRGLPDVAGMVAMSGFFVNGGGDVTLIGTSAVSPLYAGLIAVINKLLGHSVGFLNPTLYAHGREICNDITFGNNDAGPAIPPIAPGTLDSPFYISGIGWDPCTGWGSINGRRLLAALAPAPIVVTTIADSGKFADSCAGSFADEILTINNSGFSELLITNISVSPGTDFSAPSVVSYPIAVGAGESIEIAIRFQPGSLVPPLKAAQVTIVSNDLASPHTITVTGTAVGPRLVMTIAGSGDFGNVCVGTFKDERLLLSNSGKCTLSVTSIVSSSSVFKVAEVLAFPINIAAGHFFPVPIRFQPSGLGGTPPETITVVSNDPASPQKIGVSGNAPPGKLAVTGSTSFGGVTAHCCADRTISICNVGQCTLHVTSVAFKRKSRHWKLLNDPFPAALHPGSCLAVVIQYHATEKCARSCELVIESDDPTTPTKTLDVLAYTMWSECSCKEDCAGCRKGGCEQDSSHGCQQGYPCCCDDEES